MESKRLGTRITEDTHRRMKVQAAYTGRSMEEIVEEAIRDWLDVAELAQKEEKQA